MMSLDKAKKILKEYMERGIYYCSLSDFLTAIYVVLEALEDRTARIKCAKKHIEDNKHLLTEIDIDNILDMLNGDYAKGGKNGRRK